MKTSIVTFVETGVLENPLNKIILCELPLPNINFELMKNHLSIFFD